MHKKHSKAKEIQSYGEKIASGQEVTKGGNDFHFRLTLLNLNIIVSLSLLYFNSYFHVVFFSRANIRQVTNKSILILVKRPSFKSHIFSAKVMCVDNKNR